MTKRPDQPELPCLALPPELQAIRAHLRQQSVKALAERDKLPCPRCEQPLQAVNYLNPILEGANEVLLWCGCGFREY
jgi:hypothetical protein